MKKLLIICLSVIITTVLFSQGTKTMHFKPFSKLTYLTGNEYTGKYHDFVYGAIKAIYKGDYSSAPVKTISDCNQLDGFNYYLVMAAWAMLESGTTGWKSSYPEIEKTIETNMESANEIKSSSASTGSCPCYSCGWGLPGY
jgi:hypothetical protein